MKKDKKAKLEDLLVLEQLINKRIEIGSAMYIQDLKKWVKLLKQIRKDYEA